MGLPAATQAPNPPFRVLTFRTPPLRIDSAARALVFSAGQVQ